jgi:hypothetical protein
MILNFALLVFPLKFNYEKNNPNPLNHTGDRWRVFHVMCNQ